MVRGERKKALPARRVTVKVWLTANGNTGRWFQFTCPLDLVAITREFQERLVELRATDKTDEVKRHDSV